MSREWNVFIGSVIGLTTLAGCAGHPQVTESRGNVHPTTSGSEPSAEQLTSRQGDEEHRREIDELINDATAGPSTASRSAAALATADQATASLGDLLDAIAEARRVILSNVRGADTTGFKATRSRIDGHKAVLELDFSQGSLEQTTNSLDMAIQGDGFFAIKLPSGAGDRIGYSRAGNFFLNQKNELILGLGEGYRIVPPVTVATGSSNILIGQDGTIQATPPGSATPRTIALLQLTQFVGPPGLRVLDGNIFLPTDLSGPPIVATPGTNGLGLIQQGYLECSNVDLIRERLRLRFLNEWQNTIEQALLKR